MNKVRMTRYIVYRGYIYHNILYVKGKITRQIGDQPLTISAIFSNVFQKVP